MLYLIVSGFSFVVAITAGMMFDDKMPNFINRTTGVWRVLAIVLIICAFVNFGAMPFVMGALGWFNS